MYLELHDVSLDPGDIFLIIKPFQEGMKFCSRCVHQVNIYIFGLSVKRRTVQLLSGKFGKDKNVH